MTPFYSYATYDWRDVMPERKRDFPLWLLSAIVLTFLVLLSELTQ